MKRTVLVGGKVILAVGTLAMAQMFPPWGDGVDAFPPPPAQGTLDGALDANEALLKELQETKAIRGAEARAPAQELPVVTELVPIMTDAERRAEDDYLRMKIGPDVDVSGIERVPSAALNEPNRSCDPTPEMNANLRGRSGPGSRAYRDIAGYLSVTNVIATKDCTCAGKIIPHEAVAMFEDRLREKLGVTVLEPKHTRDLYDEYERQVEIVNAMCGEY